MLGKAPISSTSISGGAFKLLAVTLAATAVGTITFAGTADTKVYQNISATGTITLGGSAIWYCYYNQTSIGAITFSGDALLQIVGRPFVFHAMPERSEFFAQSENYTFNAKPESFIFRGMR